MKKIYLILLAALAISLQSCLIEDKKLFCETPAERVEAYLNEYQGILTSAENGWLFEYYPGDETVGGYAYVVKFSQSEVTAWFQLANEVNTTVSSYYKMTQDDGPVLAFDTFNDYLHFFANPSSSNYQAYQGDTEFKIMGSNPEKTEVYLRGKRTGMNLTLKKFTGDAVQYLSTANEISEALAAPAYEMIIANDTTSCSISNNVMEYEFNPTTGENAEPVTGTVALCFTNNGANFYQPVEINGVTYEGMVYNATDATLQTEDGKVVIRQIIPPLNEMFLLGNWFIKYSTLGAEGQYYFDILKKQLTAIGEELEFAFIGSMLYNSFGFNFSSSGYRGLLGLAYELQGEDVISLQFNMSGAGNGVWYHNNAGMNYALRPFGYSSARTFKLTADDNKNPTVITMTEVGNEAHSMTLFAAQIMNPFNN
jgi:hypothetical protein